MTIKERLKQLRPEIEIQSAKVEVAEVCLADHPPSSQVWDYTDSSEAAEMRGKLYHDRTTMRTPGFDPVMPILSCVNRKITTHTGKLMDYYNDKGNTVSC